MKRTNMPRSQAPPASSGVGKQPRSSSFSAAGGAKKTKSTQSAASADGWQTTPVKGNGRAAAAAAAAAPTAPKKAVASASRFAAAFAFDSDSDEEEAHVIIPAERLAPGSLTVVPAETPQEFFARLAREDPFMAALARGVSWFEAEHGEDDPVIKASQARIQAEREARLARLEEEEQEQEAPEPSAPPATQDEYDAHYMAVCHRTEEEFWAQPFTANLEERIPDYYDTTGLTDAEFHAMLAWAYDKGWNVEVCGRETVKLQSDDGPSRRYIPENFWEVHHHHHSHDHSHERPKKTSTIPRFCRAAAACEDLDCRYVHEDTIPKVNRPCGFGASCGASDPTGVKRSQCLFMHPGETWTPASCIHRP